MGRKQSGQFAERLLAWFDQHGRKNLPWQQPRTPYRVWISEIMLQQTQVSTVIPYFERWMQRFPDLVELAAAPLDEVLEHWAALGYYARARNLQRAAQLCTDQFEGQLPDTSAELCELPGIGLSTANAIISQATGQPAAVLDGNVRRVLARHSALEVWPGSTAGQKILWAEAEQRLPQKRGDDYTQAIMDLGALLCMRSKPRCDECPVSSDCQALATHAVDRLPIAKPATKVSHRVLYWLALLDDQSRILLQKRPPAGIWGGLWCLPQADSLKNLEQQCGLDLSPAHTMQPRKHRLSHVAMSIHPVVLANAPGNALGNAPGKQVISSHDLQIREATEQQWFGLEPGKLPGIPQPLAVLIEQIRNSELISGVKQ
ncbi:MAG: A/G-specific adenine glycosylase [Xanthomonadales bacterium]|nr:A/G-specific adenine glycosylase [Xanthomonadales bacterium]